MGKLEELTRSGEAHTYKKTKKYVSTTPIMDYNGRTYCVKDIIDAAQFWLGCLEKIDNRNEEKYKETELLLRGIILVLENQYAEPPRKKQVEYMIDVLKEIRDKNARSEAELQYNEQMAEILKIFAKMCLRE